MWVKKLTRNSLFCCELLLSLLPSQSCRILAAGYGPVASLVHRKYVYAPGTGISERQEFHPRWYSYCLPCAAFPIGDRRQRQHSYAEFQIFQESKSQRERAHPQAHEEVSARPRTRTCAVHRPSSPSASLLRTLYCQLVY